MKKLLNSFGYAIKGIFVAIKEQQNMRIHLLVTAGVVAAGIYFNLSAIEWSIITLTIGTVLTAEMINTAIENLVDFVSPERHPKAGKIKDVAAGAVLIAAVVAIFVGIYIFGNKIFDVIF